MSRTASSPHTPRVIIIGSQLVDTTAPMGKIILAAVFAALAIYSYHLVENPMRKFSWRDQKQIRRDRDAFLSQRYKLTALSALAVLTTALVIPALVPNPATPVSSPAPVATPLATTAAVKFAPKLEALQSQLKAALRADTWPELNPSFDSVISGGQVPQDVMPCGMEAKLVNQGTCTWGDPAATKTAVLVGDSMSLTYVETLRNAVGDKSGWNIKSFGTFACAFADERTLGISTSDDCEKRNDDATRVISELHPRVVFVAHHYLERKPDGSKNAISGDQWQAALKSRIEKILPSTVKVVFLSPPPADKDIKACFTKTSKPLDCMSRKPQHWYLISKSEQALAEKIGAVHVDTSNWFCVDDLCPSFAGGVPVKMDWAHMSPVYQGKIGDAAQEQLALKGIL